MKHKEKKQEIIIIMNSLSKYFRLINTHISLMNYFKLMLLSLKQLNLSLDWWKSSRTKRSQENLTNEIAAKSLKIKMFFAFRTFLHDFFIPSHFFTCLSFCYYIDWNGEIWIDVRQEVVRSCYDAANLYQSISILNSHINSDFFYDRMFDEKCHE